MSGPAPSDPPPPAASSRGSSAPIAGGPSASADGSPPPEHPDSASSKTAKTTRAALTLGALGVVFGDIGTSPLYALNAVFTEGVRPDQASVYGVISLVFWAITVIVSIKYVTFIMRADNDGEGGIMALISLVQSVTLKGRVAK
ncbi:MAG: KUP/HAK/KT family potassium transporter, partial [Actinomycetota bacterium]|nr:KUP/HAK/KT family potassium transporter [Actinomycetota bacterium]